MQMRMWIVSTGYGETAFICKLQKLFSIRLIYSDLSCKHFCVQGKFQAFYQYAKTFNSDDFDYEDLKNSDYIFMRWKVRLLNSELNYILQ